jgi:hypothetical protein
MNLLFMKRHLKKEKSVIVTVTDNALKDIQKLAEKLQEKGMTIKRILPITGVISGSYPFELSDIKEVTGVKAVEEEARAEF